MRTNRTLRFFALLALFCMLAPASHAKIMKIKDPRDGSIRSGDTIALDLNDYFNFGDPETVDLAKVECQVTQNAPEDPPKQFGRVFAGHDQPYLTLQYPKESKGSWMKYIDERSFVLFQSAGNLIYQETRSNGSVDPNAELKTFSVSFIGNNAKCQDAIAYGHNQSRLIVGCVSANAITKEQTIWLQILDRDTFKPVSSHKTFNLNSETTDFRIMSKLTMRYITQNDSQGNEHDYILIYDQQRQHVVPTEAQKKKNAVPRNNELALLFKVMEGEDIVQEYALTFKHDTDDNKDFTTIYDVFWHNDEFAITGRIYRPDGEGSRTIDENLYIVPCPLKLDDSKKKNKKKDTNTDEKWVEKTLNCDGSAFATGIQDGHVAQMVGSSLWARVNLASMKDDGNSSGYIEVQICQLNGAIDQFPSWKVITNLEKIPAPDTENFLGNNWLRDIQGNSNNFVLKWGGYGETTYPHAHSDSYTTTVSTEYDSVRSYPNWSGNVHNGFLYLYQLSINQFAVVRLSGIWWMATGSEFNHRIDNVVNFTCSEPQKSSASAMANIHQITKDAFRVDIQHWDPPYLDVYGGSDFRIPFGFNDYKAGNDVDFKVSFDDPIFHKTRVIHSNPISVNFKPAWSGGDNKTWDAIYFNYNAAATREGSKFKVYDCEETITEVDCIKIGEDIELHDSTAGITYNLHKDIFSGYKIIAAAATHGEGGTRKKGETRVYIVSKNGGTLTKKIDFYSESIAFTMDTENNLYVAVAYYSMEPKNSYVKVYKRTAFKPDSFDMVAHIDHNTLDAVDDYDFCPGQLHFDPEKPKQLHILSHCGIKQNKITRDKIYTQVIDSTDANDGHGRVVPFEIVSEFKRDIIPKFCPFANNFVIYSIQTNTVLSIDKKASLSSYTIPLAYWKLTNFDTFDCMSRIGMYALSAVGTDSTTNEPKFNYGLFYGDQEYNADKYVNTLLSGLDYTKWKKARSFPMNNVVLTVGYSRTDNSSENANYNIDYRTQGTLIRPPMIFASIGTMDTSYDDTQEFTMTMTVDKGIIKAKKDHKITALKENIVINFKHHKDYSGESGWLNIENYTEITGPVKSISMTPTKQDSPHLSVRDRKWFRGAMDGKAFPFHFDVYRGDIHLGVALTSNEDGETFSLVTDHGITAQFPLDGATAYDFATSAQTTERLIVFNHQDEHEEEVRALMIDDTGRQLMISKQGTGTKAKKIRVKQFVSKFLALGLDEDTGMLSVWEIQGEEQNLTFKQITSFRDVRDFDAIMSTTHRTLYVYYTKNESDLLYMAHIWEDEDDGEWALKVESSVPFNTNKRRWLDAVSCVLDDQKKGGSCAITTFGTKIYTLDLAFYHPTDRRNLMSGAEQLGLGLIKFETYNKLGGWEGDELFLTKDYLVQKAWHMSAGETDLSVNAIVWKRSDVTGTVHTSIEINQGPHLAKLFTAIKARWRAGKKMSFHHPRLLSLGAGFGTTAVSAFTDAFYKDIVIVGTKVDSAPMNYFTVSDYNIFVPEEHDNFDFATYSLNIEGQGYSQSVQVQQMFDGKTPDPDPPGPKPPKKRSISWWPFVVLLLILALSSCAWFIYVRAKQTDEGEIKEEPVYRSLQPGSNVNSNSEFESGLNPDEGDDDE